MMPSPPQGQLCTHDVPDHVALCNDIQTGKVTPEVAENQTDKWIMFSPTTWQNIQNYINQLKQVAGGKTMSMENNPSKIYITVDDINKIQDYMNSLVTQNNLQRKN